MAALDAPDTLRRPFWHRLAGSRAFQSLAARTPLLSRIARAEGAAIFDLMQGFARSQVLAALVGLDLLRRLDGVRARPAALAPAAGLTAERMELLLQAGAAVGLLRRHRDGSFGLSRRGVAFLAVPGLSQLVRHHAILYRDLADPVALLQGETAPELARFWPYVFGAGAAESPETAAAYSALMAETQALVAEDTLRLVPLGGRQRLMDVGGGTGAFLRAVAARHPGLSLTLFDLPAVLAAAELPPGAHAIPGSFRDDPLPPGADAISLVRVLYDHSDATVASLLARVHAALPSGGLLIVSEPMGGGDRPDPATDVYFALYCLAMQTGRVRPAAAIAGLLAQAGFVGIRVRPGPRRFVTSVVTALRP